MLLAVRKKTKDDCGPQYPKLNPDPAGHLIIADPSQYYIYEHESLIDRGAGSHLILPHCKTIAIDHSRPFRIIGIKFRVGVLYSLKIPTPEPLLDRVISFSLNDLIQLPALDESERLNQASHLSEACRDMLDGLLKTAFSDLHDDKHSKVVRKVLEMKPGISLSQIGTEIGCLQRTIERSFLRVTGFTLKQYYSMERLKAMLNHLHSLDKKDISWVDIALEFGFSDQPHLIRYLKDSIGNTPGQYANQRNLVIDAYGNFE